DIDVSVCSHANFCFVGAEGESILLALDIEGIAVSTGSACASGSLEPSHVLLAMGVEKEIAHSSIRFTFGKHNTKEQADRVLSILPSVIEKLRKYNPVYNKK
ncbi:aminotransferase class V-fold PLP-dependent enzyme, partial [bacterium]|nr:aminotransferase class V-fold PLP-dependent enzyme [bacterium]